MIWPRLRGSPAARSRSASRDSAAWTATPCLTGSRAVNHDITSGAGRRLVCRSASALRRRSTNDIGSRPVRRSSSRRLRPAADSSPRARPGRPATSWSTAARSSRDRHGGALHQLGDRVLVDPARRARPRACRGISPRSPWPAGDAARRGATTHVGRSATCAAIPRPCRSGRAPSSLPPWRASRRRSSTATSACSASDAALRARLERPDRMSIRCSSLRSRLPRSDPELR